MKKIILFLVIQSQAFAAVNICGSSFEKNQISIQNAMIEFLKNPESITLNQNLGLLSLSIDQQMVSSDVQKIKIRKSHANIRNEFGREVQTFAFQTMPNAACTDLNVIAEPVSGFNFGTAITPESSMATSALAELFSDENFVPRNSHEGSLRLNVFQPELCADELTATLNIVRSSQHSTGTVRKVYSYLLDKNTAQVLKQESRSGSFLKDMCL